MKYYDNLGKLTDEGIVVQNNTCKLIEELFEKEDITFAFDLVELKTLIMKTADTTLSAGVLSSLKKLADKDRVKKNSQP